MASLGQILREPVLHFAAIGSVLVLVHMATMAEADLPADVIVISSERIDQLAASFKSVWMRLPSNDELEFLIDEDVREEVYYRSALALGLDQNDTIVRRRMRQKMEFLLDTPAWLQQPSPATLEAYFKANQETYRSQLQLAFEQIYLGVAPNQETIEQSLAALQSGQLPDPALFSESSFLPANLGLSPFSAIDSVFGSGFFDLAAELAVGDWEGPLKSSFGVHLVRITEHLPAMMPSLGEVHDAVLKDWRQTKAMEIRERDYAERLQRFAVEIHQRAAPQSASR